MIHHITRTTKALIFLTLILSAVSLTAIRILLPKIQEYKTHLETEISKALDAPVKIGRLTTNIRGFVPEVVLKDIKIKQTGDEKPVIRLSEIRLGINLLGIVGKLDFMSPVRVTLVGAKLSVTRKKDGSISIVGLKSNDENPLWLLQGGRFEVLQSEVVWRDEIRQGAPLSFSNVDIAINNDFSEELHQFHIKLNLPKTLGDSLRLSMDLTGDLFASGGINGSLYAEGDNVHLAKLLEAQLLQDFNISSGSSDFKLWGEWKNSRLVSVAGNVRLSKTKIARPDKTVLPVNELSGWFRWQRLEDRWRIDVNRFILDTGAEKWPETGFSILVKGNENVPAQQIGLALSAMNLDEFARLALFLEPLNIESLAEIKKYAPKGEIENLTLFIDTEAEKFAVDGYVHGLDILPVGNAPGAKNFSAHIKGSDQGGHIKLSTENAELTFPGLFRGPLLFKEIQGDVEWQNKEDALLLISEMLIVNSPDIKTRNRLEIKIPLDESPVFMDLQSHFFDAQRLLVNPYLPTGIMDEEVVDWLDKAFVSGKGKIPQGGMLVYGDLRDFPYTEGNGLFEVLFDVKDMELAYYPGWPHFTGMDAQILFLGNGMEVVADDWNLFGAKIKHTYVTIPSFTYSDHVLIKGKVEGQIKQTLNFLKKTPLKTFVNPILKVISAKGKNKIDLDLKIPISEKAFVKVDGSARFNNADLTVLPVDIAVDNLKGELRFNERGVYTNNLQAQALGYPVKAKIINRSDMTTVMVDGRTDVINLQSLLPGQWWKLAKGQSRYNLKVSIPHDSDKPVELGISSDLKELSLLLPERLGKSAEQMTPFEFKFTFDGSSELPVNLNYANEFKVAAILDYETLRLVSGHFLLGNGEVDYPEKPKIKFQINRDDLVLDLWKDIDVLSEKENRDMLEHFNLFEVNVKHLKWVQQDLGTFDLELNRENSHWKGFVKSPMAAGRIQLPSRFGAQSRINLDLDYLDLSGLSTLNMEGDSASETPLEQPQLSLTSEKVLWQATDLGKLKLETVTDAEGSRIKMFALRSEENKLFLTGNWSAQNSRIQTQVQGKLKMDSLGDFLTLLDITDEIQEAKSEFDFSLQWPGMPYQFSIANVSGNIEAELDQGSLLGLEPGIGRVLGVFDLAQWKRRIRLDFSDMFAEGLAFDGVLGSFSIADGFISTGNLAVDGVSAKIEIQGETGLIDHKHNMIVTVTPKTSAVIPFAGTIAGFVVETLTGSHPDSLTSTQYAIKGVWGDPEIEELYEVDGTVREAWMGKKSSLRSGNQEINNEDEHE